MSIVFLQKHSFLVWKVLFLFIYSFNNNLAIGGSLTSASFSCHVEISKYNNARKTPKTIKEMQKRIHCTTKIYYSISETHPQP